MAVIENLDIVLGAKTEKADAAIAREIKQIDMFKREVSDSAVAVASFQPLIDDLSDSLTAFAMAIPGVQVATNAFGVIAAAIDAAFDAQQILRARRLERAIADITSRSRESVQQIKSVKATIIDASKAADDIIDGELVSRRVINPNLRRLGRRNEFTTERRSNPNAIGPWMGPDVGRGRSATEQAAYEFLMDEAIRKTATYTSTWRDSSQVVKSASMVGVAGATAVAGAIGAAAVAVGTLSAGLTLVRAEMQAIDELTDSANKLGVSFAELNTARLSLSQTSGMDTGAIDSALQRMSVGLAEAATSKEGELYDRLNSLGLNAGALLEQGPLQAIGRISEAIQNLKPSRQLLVAYELFGKQGAALVSSLRAGPEELDRMAVLAEQLGTNLSDAQAEMVGSANDAWEEVAMITTGAIRQLSAEFAPVLKLTAEGFAEIGMYTNVMKFGLPVVVDSMVQLAGYTYDTAQAAYLVQKTLTEISWLNFSNVQSNLAAAVDFSTADKMLDRLESIRQESAAQSDLIKSQRANQDLIVAAEKKKAESHKKTKTLEEEAAKKREESYKRAREDVDAKLLALHDEVALLKEMKRLRDAGKTPDEKALKEQLEFRRAGLVGFDSQIQKMQAERSALEAEEKKRKADLDRAEEIRKESASPEQKLSKSIAELMQLRKQGLIDDAIYKRAAKKAEEDAGFTTKKRGAVSAEAGSVEAYKLLLERENDSRARAIQQQRIQQAQLDVQRKTQKAVERFVPIRSARG